MKPLGLPDRIKVRAAEKSCAASSLRQTVRVRAASGAAVSNDFSIFLLMPPWRGAGDILAATLDSRRVARMMKRYCVLLMQQQLLALQHQRSLLFQQFECVSRSVKTLEEGLQRRRPGTASYALALQRLVFSQRRQKALSQRLLTHECQVEFYHRQQRMRLSFMRDEAAWIRGSCLLSNTLKVIGNTRIAVSLSPTANPANP